MTGARGRYAFLRSARWARVLALGVLVSLACVALGYWQWTRHSARAAAAARVEAAYDAAPVPLTDVVAPGEDLAPEDAWRPVTATGTYVGGTGVLLRNRPVSGTPAVHVLVPFVVDDPEGTAAVLVVDRGWLPAEVSDDPDAVPAPPAGRVELLVRLRPPEAPSARDAPAGQAYTVDPAAVLAATGEPTPAGSGPAPVLEAYGVLAQESPEPASAPEPLPRPDTALGSHLSYTFQWWVFAAGALVGVAVLARREAAARVPRGAAPAGPPVREPTRRRRRGPTAEEEEDALVEAAQRARTPPAGPVPGEEDGPHPARDAPRGVRSGRPTA